jgi:5-methylcytosine-specific restriction enzyme A
LIRARLKDHVTGFDVYDLELESTATLPKDHEAGHAFGRQYGLDALPAEETLRFELQAICRAYLALTYRGGLDPSAEGPTPGQGEDLPAETLIEVRRYRMHQRIERNPKASRAAKQVHGTVCQACGFDFVSAYGELGKGYIEAHHLKSLSSLQEGVPVTYDIKSDFVVLCANCHRMIHKMPDSSDFVGFQSLAGGK